MQNVEQSFSHVCVRTLLYFNFSFNFSLSYFSFSHYWYVVRAMRAYYVKLWKLISIVGKAEKCVKGTDEVD